MSDRTESSAGTDQDPARKEERIMAILKRVRHSPRIGYGEIAGWKELAMKGIIEIDEFGYRLKVEEEIRGWFRQTKDFLVQRLLLLFKNPPAPQRIREMMSSVETLMGEISTAIRPLIGQVEVSEVASRVLTQIIAGYARTSTGYIVHEVKLILRPPIRTEKRRFWN